MEIEIEIMGKGKVTGKLDERNPETAKKIYEILPIPGDACIYLEEVYLEIPIELDYENASGSAEKGDISYWPPGQAFCMFYGESQPYSEVNPIGKIFDFYRQSKS